MSYIALVNLFNYQEKSFSRLPPFPTYVERTRLVFDIDRERLHIGSKPRTTPGVERAKNGRTSGIVCLAPRPPSNASRS